MAPPANVPSVFIEINSEFVLEFIVASGERGRGDAEGRQDGRGGASGRARRQRTHERAADGTVPPASTQLPAGRR